MVSIGGIGFSWKTAISILGERLPQVEFQLVLNKHPTVLDKGQVNENSYQKLAEDFVCNKKFSLAVISVLRPVLSVLLGRIVNKAHMQWHSAERTSLNSHEELCHCLSFVTSMAPHASRYVDEYFRIAPAPFERLIQEKNGVNNSQDLDSLPLLEVVQATLRLIQSNPALFIDLWDWSIFLDLLRFQDTSSDEMTDSLSEQEKDIRWTSVQILSRVLRMTDSDTEGLATFSELTDENILESQFRWDEIEQKIRKERERMFWETSCLLEDTGEKSTGASDCVITSDSRDQISICGIELPVRKHKDEKWKTGSLSSVELILTPSTRKNLESVVLALCQGRPVLLEGLSGCGKSTLLDALAHWTGNTDMIRLHMDDQMDSKTLLGSYICTDIPGEFRWHPGALTQAVTKGLWIVFEDIDSAPFEILSALLPLLEDRKLFIPSRGETIVAEKNFQIFGTVTTSAGPVRRSSAAGGKEFLKSQWMRVRIEAPLNDELATIVQSSFPSMSAVLPAMIDTLELMKSITSLSAGTASSQIHFSRQFSTRDLMKWCKRLKPIFESSSTSSFLTHQLRERIFQEAMDVFACGIPRETERSSVLRAIAAKWDISPDRAEYFLDLNKPQIQSATTVLHVGRAAIHIAPQKAFSVAVKASGGVFAATGHVTRLMERIAVCVQHKEPVLLVGETGTGKTAVVQQLARSSGARLTVLNMSQQTDSSDFLGGFKPVEMQSICSPLMELFSALFRRSFPSQANGDFLGRIQKYMEKKKWKNLLKGFRSAVERVSTLAREGDVEKPGKRSRQLAPDVLESWKRFDADLERAERQVAASESSFAFSFVEGALVKALREGHWLLLDEINLAPAETLERLTGVLEQEGSICLTEKGDIEMVPRHPAFRIFGCMNPATDVAKRDLPPALKNRFTEFYVDELSNRDDLFKIVSQYFEGTVASPPVTEVVDFYLVAKQEAKVSLVDGANQSPQYSLRTLCRALEYVRSALPIYGLLRSLYDGFAMCFLTLLDANSGAVMERLISTHLLKQMGTKRDLKSLLRAPAQPSPNHVLFEHFWVERGDCPAQDESISGRYVLTESVRQHLKNLARAVLVRKYPILLQGPTSSGKTSLVEYLANCTGHKFVRLSNHEHTDLQEYLGNYVTDPSGKLVFQEGALVQAVRHGYWIVLDELNLAPSDVLEALNRLLDDNRELFVPELQITIQPHPHFMLFATQNPPGIYGGRKVLSKAFRNRFMELHVDDIPDDELQVIVEKRCQIPPSYASRMVEVMKELQRRRQSSDVFAGRHGFITSRDLFRWADRHANGYEELAMDGYLLLAERLREQSEKAVVQTVLEQRMRVKLNFKSLDEEIQHRLDTVLSSPQAQATFGKIVWTGSMRRLFHLVYKCLLHNEPVLLVGDTGCGKTTVCQMAALLLRQKMHILNCHQHTETSDFLGGYRPVRDRDRLATRFCQLVGQLAADSLLPELANLSTDLEKARSTLAAIKTTISKRRATLEASEGSGMAAEDGVGDLESCFTELKQVHAEWQSLFEWVNGPLVEAMVNGDMILLDEISLAEDAVLERLNSVLEPKRQLVLAEKGGTTAEQITASGGFRILATMNPGGDFGKKELSPALRNRFTEIWVPSFSDATDLKLIVQERLETATVKCLAEPLLEFWQWFQKAGNVGKVMSLRDLLSWVTFINKSAPLIGLFPAYVHGAFLVLLDGIGLGLGLAESAGQQIRNECFQFLITQIPENERENVKNICDPNRSPQSTTDPDQNQALFGIPPFYIPRGCHGSTGVPFELSAPTTSRNGMRVLRAMQLPKPVLLEGSPGVGKTSLISAMASASGHRLVRINLSEQTDMMDLLGTDLPVEGGKGGDFSWSDGVFLRALKAGDWVLLDELNLASQSVLEGLNSCLDHRGEVYLPELNRTFKCPPSFRIFAAQNPVQQGGGRKGLPKSFLNRFTKVYVQSLDEEDLLFICLALNPRISPAVLQRMIRFNERLRFETMEAKLYAQEGAPWEFNLRDVLRWCQLIAPEYPDTVSGDPGAHLDLIYLQRMRTKEDRLHVLALYESVFGQKPAINLHPNVYCTSKTLHVGPEVLELSPEGPTPEQPLRPLQLLPSSLFAVQSIVRCIKGSWPCLLVGPPASGKTSLLRQLAAATGRKLVELALTWHTDASDLIGCFEQGEPGRRAGSIGTKAYALVLGACGGTLGAADVVPGTSLSGVRSLLGLWTSYRRICGQVARSGDRSKELEMLRRVLEAVRELSPSQPRQLASVVAELAALEKLVAASGWTSPGRFEWTEGGLLGAMVNGDWVVLENANLCNPTVLDRLNSVLEPGGSLLLNERGNLDCIKPHPNFRLFLTMDPKFGEVSRAMRNRAAEIFLMEPGWLPEPEKNIITQAVDVPPVQVMDNLTLASRLPVSLAVSIAKSHYELGRLLESSGKIPPGARELAHFLDLFVALVERGVPLPRSLHSSWQHAYRACLTEDDKTLSGIVKRQKLEHDTGDLFLEAEKIFSHVLESEEDTSGMLLLASSVSFVEASRCSKVGFLRHEIGLLLALLDRHGSRVDWGTAEWHLSKTFFAVQCYLERVRFNEGPRMRCRSLQLAFHHAPKSLSSLFERVITQHLAQVDHPLVGTLVNSSCQLYKDCERRDDGIFLDAGTDEGFFGYVTSRVWPSGNGNRTEYDRVSRLSWGARLLAQFGFQWCTEENFVGAGNDTGALTTIIGRSFRRSSGFRDSNAGGELGEDVWAYPVIYALRKIEAAVFETFGPRESASGEFSTAVERLLAWHIATWRLLIRQTLDQESFSFVWRCLKKAVLKLSDSGTESREIDDFLGLVSRVDSALGIPGGTDAALMWRDGGKPKPAKVLEGVLEDSKITEICESVLTPKYDGTVLAGFSDELRRLGLDGICVVRFAATASRNIPAGDDQDPSPNFNFPDIRNTLTERISSHEATLSKAGSLKMVPSVQNKQRETSAESGMAVWGPLCAYESVRELWKRVVPFFDMESLRFDRDFLAGSLMPLLHFQPHKNDTSLRQQLGVLKAHISSSLSKSSRSPSDLGSHQQLVWMLESPEFNGLSDEWLSTLVHEMWYSWHSASWKASFQGSVGSHFGEQPDNKHSKSNPSKLWDLTAGPSRMFLATQATFSTALTSGKGSDIKDHQVRLLQVHEAASHWWSFAAKKGPDLAVADLQTARFLFCQILYAHKSSFESVFWSDSVLPFLASFANSSRANLEATADSLTEQFQALMSCSSHGRFTSLVSPLLAPCFNSIAKSSAASGAESALPCGESWLLIGCTKLHLILPSDACDPAAKFTLKKKQLERQLGDLDMEIEARVENELFLTGGQTNLRINRLSESREILKRKIAALTDRAVARPDPPQFSSFFRETARFIATSASVERMRSLVASLKQNDVHSGVQSQQEAATWQATALAFIQRLRRQYPLYRDVVQPVQLAVYEMVYGLNLMVTWQALRPSLAQRATLEENLCYLMEFPQMASLRQEPASDSVFSAAMEVSENAYSSQNTDCNFTEFKIDYLQTCLTRMRTEAAVSKQLKKQTLKSVRSIIGSMASLWGSMRERQVEREREEAELFKNKAVIHELESEMEENEEEFKEMFPDHFQDFADLEVKEFVSAEEDDARAKMAELEISEAQTEEQRTESRIWNILQGKLVKSVAHIYRALFAPRKDMPMDDSVSTQTADFLQSYSTGTKLLRNYLSGVASWQVDSETATGHLMCLCLELQKLDRKLTPSTPMAEEIDIYKDSSPGELSLMLDPVQMFLDRVDLLLCDWPDNPILEQLVAICKRVLCLEETTPIARALVGIELLLNKAQVWEENAARHVSLAVELDALSGLVARWRKLELASWRTVLKHARTNHEDETGKMFFVLHGLIHREVVEGSEWDLDATVTSLEEFVQASSLGDFENRVDLLRCFEVQLSAEMAAECSSDSSSRSETSEKLRNVLHNMAGYYGQFLPTAAEALQSLTGPIEKELNDFARLAKWEDRNHYSLAASADKAHRKLHKYVRKYVNCLRKPLLEVLTGESQKIGQPWLQKARNDEKSAEDNESKQAEAKSMVPKQPTEEAEEGKVRELAKSLQVWSAAWSHQVLTPGTVSREPSIRLAFRIDSPSLYQNRIPALANKLSAIIASCTFSEFERYNRSAGRGTIEDLQSAILVRSESLRTGNKPTPMKKKALVDLLKALKKMGLSTRKSAIPEAERTFKSWLFQPPADLTDLFSSHCFSQYDSHGSELFGHHLASLMASCDATWQKASVYHFKNMAGIRRMWELSISFSRDLSLMEVEASQKFVEHLACIQRRQRRQAHTFACQLSQLDRALSLLSEIGTSENPQFMDQALVRPYLWKQKELMDELWFSADQVLNLLTSAVSCRVAESLSAMEAKKTLEKALSTVKACKDKLDSFLVDDSGLKSKSKLSDWPVLVTPKMQAALHENFKKVSELELNLKQHFSAENGSDNIPGWLILARVFQKFASCHGELKAESEKRSGTTGSHEILTEQGTLLSEEVEKTVQSVLIAGQKLAKIQESVEAANVSIEAKTSEEDEVEIEGTIFSWEGAALQPLESIQMPTVLTQVHRIIHIAGKLSGQCKDGDGAGQVAAILLHQLHGLLVPLLTAGLQIMADFVAFHGSVAKLSYILSNLFCSLFSQGFCVTEEEREAKEGEGQKFDTEGTGMGEGEGKKDVSDEIEDEEQLVGTNDEKMEEEEKKGEEKSKGVEMEQEFDGKMFDLSEDESDENEEDGEEEKEERMEDEMGDVGEEGDVVDEKLWNKEEEEKDGGEGEKEQEKFEENAPISGADDDEIEYRGMDEKEEDKEENGGQKDKEKERAEKGEKGEKDKEEENGVEEEGEGQEENEDGRQEEKEETHGIKPQAEDDMEIPEDMKMDEGDDGEEEEGEAGEDGGETQEDKGEEKKEEEQEEFDENMAIDDGKDEAMDDEMGEDTDEMKQDGEDGDMANNDAVEEVEKEAMAEDENEVEKVTKAGEEQGINEENVESMDAAVEEEKSGKQGAKDAIGVKSGSGGNEQEKDGEDRENRSVSRQKTGSKGSSESNPADKSREVDVDGKEKDAAEEESNETGKNESKNQELNPDRLLGDMLKKWKERARVVGDSEPKEEGKEEEGKEKGEGEKEEEEEATDAAEYEFLGEEKKGAEQALGFANEEQMRELGEKEEEGEEESGADKVGEEGEDVAENPDEGEEPAEQTAMDESLPKKSKSKRGEKHSQEEEEGKGNEQSEEGMEEDTDAGAEDVFDAENMEADFEKRRSLASAAMVSNPVEHRLKLEEIMEETAPLTEAEKEQLREQLEDRVSKMAETEPEKQNLVAESRSTWRKYEMITNSLSHELSEQLRLILEPSLATKLEGDYRSGKRINMKKVIQYIASEFRRDKIWLRRTKADKRQYQVVLAIDDSRSMRETHCGHLALEATAAICQAMSHLDVADVAVIGFGERGNVKLVHEFDQPFTADAGAHIVSSFSFSCDNTLSDRPMEDLILYLTGLLDQGALRVSTPVSQLVLIIADGKFHEKESLRRCVREAMAAGQLLAFIVLDNPEESLMDTQSVSFSSGAPKMTKYLDSFPFPHYILLQNISTLPRTLANLLRQWFELTQKSAA